MPRTLLVRSEQGIWWDGGWISRAMNSAMDDEGVRWKANVFDDQCGWDRHVHYYAREFHSVLESIGNGSLSN